VLAAARFIRSLVMVAASIALLLPAQVAAAQQGQRMSGYVSSYADGTVLLDDGASFDVNDSTRVVVSTPGTIDDLQNGQYVAITATRLDDGTLLASIVRRFPESQRGSFGGQFVQSDGNLMTNANIDEATIDAMAGGLLMVTFQGNMEHVVVPPTAQIIIASDGTIDSIAPGEMITASVTDGWASSINVAPTM
jgi:flagellar basal body rod protein FlgF